MNTYRRIASVAATVAFAAFTGAPASGASAPADQERPCFIVQPRWNSAFGGPAPPCPVPD